MTEEHLTRQELIEELRRTAEQMRRLGNHLEDTVEELEEEEKPNDG